VDTLRVEVYAPNSMCYVGIYPLQIWEALAHLLRTTEHAALKVQRFRLGEFGGDAETNRTDLIGPAPARRH